MLTPTMQSSDMTRRRAWPSIDEIADANRRLERLYEALETGKVQIENLAPRIQQLRCRQEKTQNTAATGTADFGAARGVGRYYVTRRGYYFYK